jgi:hypothetical protein
MDDTAGLSGAEHVRVVALKAAADVLRHAKLQGLELDLSVTDLQSLAHWIVTGRDPWLEYRPRGGIAAALAAASEDSTSPESRRYRATVAAEAQRIYEERQQREASWSPTNPTDVLKYPASGGLDPDSPLAQYQPPDVRGDTGD